MGEKTGIAWTDSTQNWWIGCTKVGPGCDHCYAVDVGARSGVPWGPGAPRRQTGEHNRNSLARYQRKAEKFKATHGRRQRVFCSSLSDIFDNEVPDEWRAEAFTDMEAAPDVLVQICTKRVSNVAKMIPFTWHDGGAKAWPQNVGLLITTVTPEEILRDVPRLLELKRRFGIPWVGLSIEPMIADVMEALEDALRLQRAADEASGFGITQLDWVILGGESGALARECQVRWIMRASMAASDMGVSVFVKQLGSKPLDFRENNVLVPLKLKNRAGKDPEEWPESRLLHRREFPAALDG